MPFECANCQVLVEDERQIIPIRPNEGVWLCVECFNEKLAAGELTVEED